jgi:excisionase family DNA binding protein
MQQDRRPLYVRLPADAADTLDRVALERRTSKQDLVADLIVGRADFRKEPAAVLTLGETAELLQTTDAAVVELAEAGELPGRKVGGEWRFSRTAVLHWLGE